MKSIVLIPARMASTRLPGKPLADIVGVPMIVRVWRQAIAAQTGPVVVAAAEREIADAVERVGGRAIITDPALASGTDRVHAAIECLDREGAYDIVVNLQGDLPTVEPACLRSATQALATTDADIATLAAPITEPSDRENPNVVKAIVAWDAGGRCGRALYFTRATAPAGEGPVFAHIGIYAYRRAALRRFVELPPSALESRERLEQLRAMEAGMAIAVARVDAVPLSVDTPCDLERARKIIALLSHPDLA